MAEKNQIKVKLYADRVTKGAVRFMEKKEEFPINVYLRKEQVDDLGLEAEEGVAVEVIIKPLAKK